MEFKLTTCALREWEAGDEQSLVHYANNRRIWLNVRDMFPFPYTPEDPRQWVEIGSRKKGTLSLAVVVGHEAVGGIGLVFKDDIFRKTAEFGFWLGEEFWGRGIMTEAVEGLTGYAFSHFDLAKIFAGVFEWNHASMRVLEKAGYSLEARLRKNVVKDDKLVDELIYATVRE